MKIYLVAILLTIGLYCHGSLKGVQATAIVLAILVVSSLVHKEGVEIRDIFSGKDSPVIKLDGPYSCRVHKPNTCPDPTIERCLNLANGQWGCDMLEGGCPERANFKWCKYTNCEEALEGLCADDKKKSPEDCQSCTSIHKAEINEMCTDTEITDFCKADDMTCPDAMKLYCPHDQQKDEGDCLACMTHHQGALQDAQCRAGDFNTYCKAEELTCEEALESVCADAKKKSSKDCQSCTSAHQMDLKMCSESQITDFCPANMTCPDALKRYCPLDQQKSIGDCKMCTGEHQQALMKAQCQNEDFDDYCRRWTPGPGPGPGPGPDVPQCPGIHLRKITACTQSECRKPNGDLKCGPANTYLARSKGACIDTCKIASQYEKDIPGDICYLNKGCKQNLCLPETVPSDVSDDAGKIKFRNQTNQGPMFVLFDTDPPVPATISNRAAVKQTIGSGEIKYYYQVDNSETLVFDISQTQWMSGKCYIVGKDPNTAKPGVFNGSGLGGLEWSVTATACHTNLSAVDGINFDSEVNVYNIDCGGQHERTCQLDWASCPNQQMTGDGQLTCKAPMAQRDFMTAVCPQALQDECTAGWTFESDCYMKNIINKYECLKAWGNPDGSSQIGVDGGSLEHRQKWLQFLSNGGKCNIYPWSYGEQMIQEPSDAALGTIDTIDFMTDNGVAMERTADNWVKSKDYLCLTSRKCDEFCDWKVVSNPNQPLIACEPNVNLNPPVKYPVVLFQIKHIYNETDGGKGSHWEVGNLFSGGDSPVIKRVA